MSLSVVAALATTALTFAAAPSSKAAIDAEKVASAYLDATSGSEIAAATKVFATDSLIFETGGVEGSWATYRDHHLAPELKAIKSFVLTRGESRTRTSSDGTMAYVAWPITYKIDLADGRKIDSKGTVTFVLTRKKGASFKIEHLHWSSRKLKKDAGHGGHDGGGHDGKMGKGKMGKGKMGEGKMGEGKMGKGKMGKGKMGKGKMGKGKMGKGKTRKAR